MTNQALNTPIFWLQDAGYSAYLVGNQVRDRLTKMVSDRKDVDIATNALPHQVISVLRKNNLLPGSVDEKFGTVAFRYNEVLYEVTTFREDLYHRDFEHISRYPDEIRFVQVAAQDAPRRDITINAIYFNPKTSKYLDYVGGLEDLKNRTIRLIGDPTTRLLEDPIRILRTVRFKYLLGFKYDPKTAKALKASGHLLKKLSPGVVKKEFAKIQSLPEYQTTVKRELRDLGIVQTL